MADNNNNVYYNKNGDIVPRVSDILKMLNKEQLLFWSNMLGFKRISYRSELDRTARIGSAIHDMIELYNRPDYLAIYDWNKYKIYNKYDKLEVINGLKSFTKWYNKNRKKFKIIDTEKQVVGKYFGGTIDCIISSPFSKDGIIIVDYKTSSSIHMTQFLQLSAYAYLCETELKIKVDGVMVLRMDRKYGEMAEDALIMRKYLDTFIKLFFHLYNTLVINHKLNKSLSTLKIKF